MGIDEQIRELEAEARILRAIRSREEVALAPCSLCKAAKGEACRKPSGVPRPPHAERRRAARKSRQEAGT